MTSPQTDSASIYRSASREGLGPLLVRLRRARGRSQRRLADDLCAASGVATVSRHEISRWEREERLPSEFWLAWLSEVLGEPPDRLRRAATATRVHRAGAGRAPDPLADGGWPWRVFAFNCTERPGGGVALVPVDIEPAEPRPLAPGLIAVT